MGPRTARRTRAIDSLEVSDSDAAAAYLASLHRKRMASGVLFLDAAGRALLVEPTYTKETWDIPGGGVEEDESPRAAARREVAEELGLDREPGRLLAVDYVARRGARTEGVMYVFDGGPLTDDEIAAIRLPPDELASFAFVDETRAAELLRPRLARRLAAAIRAREAGTAVYLENGSPP
jgi:8-oxo-dGTP pyrophosphatase MutT (NUDIX family)